jgi:hypothetical protein
MWRLWSPEIPSRDAMDQRWLKMRTTPIEQIIMREVTKNKLRSNQLAFADIKFDGGRENKRFILTGFTRQTGKETTYDGIVIEGVKTGHHKGEPYKIYEKDGVPESKIDFIGIQLN